VARRNVVIELTETCTAQREEAIETIRLLRQAGHQVHIDDFGTGYSSLSYLKDLAVDAIKIDQSFTQAIGTESVTVAILPQILAIAEALNVDVTVEGVETARQAAYFMNSRVPIFAQGWLFGRPAPIEEFVCMLNASTAKAEREWAAEDETEFALPVGAM
jgi:sensor c-di-GMP phosphodiesterase-like protein